MELSAVKDICIALLKFNWPEQHKQIRVAINGYEDTYISKEEDLEQFPETAGPHYIYCFLTCPSIRLFKVQFPIVNEIMLSCQLANELGANIRGTLRYQFQAIDDMVFRVDYYSKRVPKQNVQIYWRGMEFGTWDFDTLLEFDHIDVDAFDKVTSAHKQIGISYVYKPSQIKHFKNMMGT
jgi:hypothetical protein